MKSPSCSLLTWSGIETRYLRLEKHLIATFPYPRYLFPSLQVVIDQVFWAPIFTLIFFTWIGITSGNSPSEIVNKVKSDLIQGVVGSWTVWPLAHTINFKYVPTEQRLLYINSIQIFYNVFLSIIGSK